MTKLTTLKGKKYLYTKNQETPLLLVKCFFTNVIWSSYGLLKYNSKVVHFNLGHNKNMIQHKGGRDFCLTLLN